MIIIGLAHNLSHSAYETVDLAASTGGLIQQSLLMIVCISLFLSNR